MSQGASGVAVGTWAGSNGQGTNGVAVGKSAGKTGQGISSVAIGSNAGSTSQGGYSVAVGSFAGYNGQGLHGVAIGYEAGDTSQGNVGTAIGYQAGSSSQGGYNVAIGHQAGKTGQGISSVAIGTYAGAVTNQHTNSIILNASGFSLDSDGASRTFIKPIRNVTSGNYLYYNSGTGEITYNSTSDRRMKRNLQLANYSAVDEISKLKVYTFEEKDNGIQPANDNTVWTPSVGVLSQELYKYAPTMRHTIHIPADVGDIDSFVPPEDPNDPTVDWSVWGTETAGIDHMRLVPHTMKAIQELNQEIINLKARIAELENASAPGQ